MTFFEALTRVIGLLVLHGSVSYQAIKLEFNLDEAQLEALRVELTKVHQLAQDHDGQMLVWTGRRSAPTPDPVLRVPPVGIGMTASAALLTTAMPVEDPQMVPAGLIPSTSAERRQVTVLFCDLAGSTELARRLGNEDYGSVVRAYQEAVETAIGPFGGYVAQYLGDGLLLYFGWPQAYEDAAQRAVHAGLAIIAVVGELSSSKLEPHYKLRLNVRCGLHTGMAVMQTVGSGERQERLAMGDTANIAARIQGLAGLDTVVLSSATARLVEQNFALEPLGVRPIKGVTEPMALFRVAGLLPAPDEGDWSVAAERRSPFLVGRHEEIGLLRRLWEQSHSGRGQVVLLSGEAGIGKSTLVQALHVYVASQGAAHIVYRCSPYHTNSALHPLIAHLNYLLGLDPDDSDEVRLNKLEEVLGAYGQALVERLPLMAALLSIPLPEGRFGSPAFTSQQQRQQTLDTIVDWLLEEAVRQPVLTVWEDLHWADPSTLELLGLVLEQAPTAAMLHVLTYRPDFVPPWPARSDVTPMVLNRLEHPQVEALVTHLCGGRSLPAEVLEHIAAKTDGVPLFVEELTKALLESPLLQNEDDHYVLTGALTGLRIPSTLQDSLMARLDRLPGAKEISQFGAVLGREFTYEMLRGIVPLEETRLRERLAQLVQAELLYHRGRPPRARYMFKHALIQDAAYQSLLRSRRRQIHEQVARELETRFADIVATQPELVAHHYTQAGCQAQAVTYWELAGQEAITRSAEAEAVGHLDMALELLKSLPENTERSRRELALLVMLGPALMAIRGIAAAEAETVYLRAWELCRADAEPAQRWLVIRGLWNFYLLKGQVQKGGELAGQLLPLARQMTDVSFTVETHWVMGVTRYLAGAFGPALEHLEQGIALRDPYKQASRRILQDPDVSCLVYAGQVLWYLGFARRGLARTREGLDLAERLAHPYSLVWSHYHTALIHYLRREPQKVQEQAEIVLAGASKRGFALWLAGAAVLCGWSKAAQGQTAEGLEQVHEGVAAWQATGALVFQPLNLACLAEAYGWSGRPEEARAALAEALHSVAQSGERRLEAELHRLQGELLLSAGADGLAEAEACFRQALEVARGQQAKAWQLRAALSLARIDRQRNPHSEALRFLSEVYNGFSEGFDTPDLKEAQALLNSSSG